MITSQEINAMIAMQQQQVGYMGGVPMAVPMSGASQYPPQFSYAPRPMAAAHIGQAAAGGLMNSVGPGAGGLSGMAFGITGAAGLGAAGAGFLGFGTAAAKGVAGTGLAGSLGALESNALLSGMSRLNPLNSMMMGGMAGVAEAGGMGSLLTGAGIRAGLAGAFGTAGLLHPVSVAAMATAAPLMAMHRGAQQYSQTSAMLGAYNQFANPFASTGRGFSENQMSSMVSGMRSIQEASPFISMRDMQQTMTRFNEMGMNQGERDAEEFSRKFKAMAKTVTAMSKALGTTMDEASKVFGQMRGVGFYTGSDVMQNTVLAGTMRGEGISGATMLGAQAAGGGITRASGLGTTPGAKSVGGVMAMLTGGRGAGALTNEEMMNITGAATPDQAIAQLSTTMAGSLTGFYTGTGVGQAMLAALGQTNARGEFTGGLDAEAVEALRSGQIDINNLVSKGRGKVSTRNAALSFKTRGQDVAGALLSEGDPTAAIGAIMQSVAGDKFRDMDPENLVTLLTEKIQGLGRKEAEAMTKLYREGEKIRRESQQQMRQEIQSEIFATDVRESHSYEGFKRRVLGGVSDMFSPLGQMGQDISVGLGQGFQRMSDRVFGVTRMGVSGDVRHAAYLRMLRGEADVDVGQVGRSGFSTAELTTSGLRGTAAASDFAAPANANEQKIYEDLQKAFKGTQLGRAMGSGQTVEEYIRAVPIDTSLAPAGGFNATYRNTRGMPASATKTTLGAAMSEGGYGGVSTERLRELAASAAAGQGATAAVRELATMTDKTSMSLQERKTAQEALLGGEYGVVQKGIAVSAGRTVMGMVGLSLGPLGGLAGLLGGGELVEAMYGTDAGAYDQLQQVGGMDVVSRLADAGVSNEQFMEAMDTARQTGKTLEEVLPGVDLKGVSPSKAEAYYQWAKSTGNAGLSVDTLRQLKKNQGAAQQIMDFSNLAAMSAASAENADIGQKELLGLKMAAEGGGTEDVRSASDALFKVLADAGIQSGDVTEEKYGALAKTLQTAMAHRNIIDTGSDKDIREMLVKGMGFSEKEVADLDISNREDLASRVAALDIRRGGESAGGAFTDSTQEQATKYYAEMFAKVNDQILRIQSNNDKLEAKIEALQPD